MKRSSLESYAAFAFDYCRDIFLHGEKSKMSYSDFSDAVQILRRVKGIDLEYMPWERRFAALAESGLLDEGRKKEAMEIHKELKEVNRLMGIRHTGRYGGEFAELVELAHTALIIKGASSKEFRESFSEARQLCDSIERARRVTHPREYVQAAADWIRAMREQARQSLGRRRSNMKRKP